MQHVTTEVEESQGKNLISQTVKLTVYVGMKENKSVKVTFTLPQSTLQKLKDLAEKTNLKMSTIVKLGIEKMGGAE